MTDEMPTEAEDSVSQNQPNWRRELEDRAKAGTKLSQLAQLQRELSFRDAGVDPNTKQGQYFMRGYDGEMTADAIRAEAAELGLTGQRCRPRNPRLIMGLSSGLRWRLTMLVLLPILNSIR